MLERKAAYWDTGVWSSKAIEAARYFGEVEVSGSGKDCNYSRVTRDFIIPSDADYLHITTNNTIYGTETRYDIESPIPLIADMSSDILTRPVDVSRYAIIYGGAQKNAGPAGVTFVIVNDDVLGKVSRKIPAMMDYKVHIKNESMYNTPPVISIFMMKETLKWVKDIGGIAEIQKRNSTKAELLYNEIDRNTMFKGTADKDDRSLMNICFIFEDRYKGKEKDFLKFAGERGIDGIKGHRSVGGFRASCYNAVALESVQALVDCMKDFEAQFA